MKTGQYFISESVRPFKDQVFSPPRHKDTKFHEFIFKVFCDPSCLCALVVKINSVLYRSGGRFPVWSCGFLEWLVSFPKFQRPLSCLLFSMLRFLILYGYA